MTRAYIKCNHQNGRSCNLNDSFHFVQWSMYESYMADVRMVHGKCTKRTWLIYEIEKGHLSNLFSFTIFM